MGKNTVKIGKLGSLESLYIHTTNYIVLWPGTSNAGIFIRPTTLCYGLELGSLDSLYIHTTNYIVLWAGTRIAGQPVYSYDQLHCVVGWNWDRWTACIFIRPTTLCCGLELGSLDSLYIHTTNYIVLWAGTRISGQPVYSYDQLHCVMGWN